MAKAKPIKTDTISDRGAKTTKPRKPRAIPADATTSEEWRASATSVPKEWKAALAPSSPAPATDAVSVHCANKRENKTNTRDETGTADSTREAGRQTPLSAPTDSQHVTGDDLLSGAVSAGNSPMESLESLPLARARDGETRKQCWERLRQEARTAGMTRRDSVAYAGITVDQVWSPPQPVVDEIPIEEEPVVLDLPEPEPEPEPEFSPIGEKAVELPKDDQGVPGLGDLPDSWGILPANASLQVEISWVSANRLRVRDGAGVDLSKALSPAPSYSALSWLETSILFPSKFADISVKATANQDDEKEAVRREKLAIEEVRGLLAEMLEG